MTPLAIMAAGVTPRLELALGAGLEIRDGAVATDAAMRTSAPGVLAAGDVCDAFNATAGRALRVEHWGDALGQGEVAGRTAAGRDARWDAVPGFWSTIGDHTLKYVAWGDGFDDVTLDDGDDGAFVARYRRDGRLVGVLTHDDDDAYDDGRREIAEQAAAGAMTYVVVPAHDEERPDRRVPARPGRPDRRARRVRRRSRARRVYRRHRRGRSRRGS